METPKLPDGSPLPGATRFTVVSWLAEGGQAVVYKVKDPQGRILAAKVFGAPWELAGPPLSSGDWARAVTRVFKNTAAGQVAAKEGAAVVPAKEVLVWRRGHDGGVYDCPILIFDLYPLGDLRSALGRLDAVSARRITWATLREAFSVLADLHDRDIAHGDIRTANLLLRDTGRIGLVAIDLDAGHTPSTERTEGRKLAPTLVYLHEGHRRYRVDARGAPDIDTRKTWDVVMLASSIRRDVLRRFGAPDEESGAPGHGVVDLGWDLSTLLDRIQRGDLPDARAALAEIDAWGSSEHHYTDLRILVSAKQHEGSTTVDDGHTTPPPPRPARSASNEATIPPPQGQGTTPPPRARTPIPEPVSQVVPVTPPRPAAPWVGATFRRVALLGTGALLLACAPPAGHVFGGHLAREAGAFCDGRNAHKKTCTDLVVTDMADSALKEEFTWARTRAIWADRLAPWSDHASAVRARLEAQACVLLADSEGCAVAGHLLLPFLDHPDPEVRVDAARSLAWLHEGGAYGGKREWDEAVWARSIDTWLAGAVGLDRAWGLRARARHVAWNGQRDDALAQLRESSIIARTASAEESVEARRVMERNQRLGGALLCLPADVTPTPLDRDTKEGWTWHVCGALEMGDLATAADLLRAMPASFTHSSHRCEARTATVNLVDLRKKVRAAQSGKAAPPVCPR